LYINIPSRRVKTGERAFSIPARELLIFVSARGKRNAGIALPMSPMRKIEKMFDLFSLRRFLRAIGNKHKKVIRILRDPTCNEEKDSSPFFIRI